MNIANFKHEKLEYFEIVEASSQGKRSYMEDYSSYLYPYITEKEASLFLSVFDGHAGPRCSQFLSTELPNEVLKFSSQGIPNTQTVKDIFQGVDNRWMELAKGPRYEDGSTALCIALDGADLVVANCGDCRAILSQKGHTVILNKDHKPTDEEEQQRIVSQGGIIIGGRLQGQLGVSRAFGNYEFKESHILSSEPEISHFTLSCDTEYLIVGSDGLYEQFSNDEIISFLKTGVVSANLDKVVKDLMEEAIDRGCDDNITIIVVKFEQSFKKLLKKREKKHSGKQNLLTGKSGGLRTSGKTPKEKPQPESPPPELSKPGISLKKGLGLGTSAKYSLSFHSLPADQPSVQKKKTEPKKQKPSQKLTTTSSKPPSPREKPFEEEKLSIFHKAFKHDFFNSNRTAVIISG